MCRPKYSRVKRTLNPFKHQQVLISRNDTIDWNPDGCGYDELKRPCGRPAVVAGNTLFPAEEAGEEETEAAGWLPIPPVIAYIFS